MPGNAWILVLVLFCAFLASIGQVFFKMGSKTFEFSIVGILGNYKFILGATLYGLSALLFVFALKQGELSILYPIIATSYIWVLFLSHFFFEESITMVKITGVMLIVSGVALITKGGV